VGKNRTLLEPFPKSHTGKGGVGREQILGKKGGGENGLVIKSCLPPTRRSGRLTLQGGRGKDHRSGVPQRSEF